MKKSKSILILKKKGERTLSFLREGFLTKDFVTTTVELDSVKRFSKALTDWKLDNRFTVYLVNYERKKVSLQWRNPVVTLASDYTWHHQWINWHYLCAPDVMKCKAYLVSLNLGKTKNEEIR